MLERGSTPASIQLGEDCTQPACANLLTQIYDRWCKGGSKRRHKRHPASGQCALVSSVEAIHQQISGQTFKQPGELDLAQLRKEREMLSTFDSTTLRSQQIPADSGKWSETEEWELVDQSSAGIGITRLLKQGGKRIGCGQLIAVKPENSRAPLLGCVRWVVVTPDNMLKAGIQLFPGEPVAAAVRNKNAQRGGVHYERAFLLPAFPKLKQPASLIIPHAWFQTGLRVDLHNGDSHEVMLTALLEHGCDFDRVSFV